MGTKASQITSLTIVYSGRRSTKTSKFRVTGLCAGNSPGTGEFPVQMASNAGMFPFDDVIMWWFGEARSLGISSCSIDQGLTGYPFFGTIRVKGPPKGLLSLPSKFQSNISYFNHLNSAFNCEQNRPRGTVTILQQMLYVDCNRHKISLPYFIDHV